MKTKRRVPIMPSEAFIKELRWAERHKKSITADGVSITPPARTKGNWRLRITVNGKLIERSGGQKYETVYAALLDLMRHQEYSNRTLLGLPAKGHFLLEEAISHYFEVRGPNGIWKQRTKENRSDDFNHLVILARAQSLKCEELTPPLMREYLSNATATLTRAKTIEGVLKTFVEWGYQQGYFDKSQVEASRLVRWSPPAGSGYLRAPTRRAQSKLHFGDESQEGGEVPTHQQVLDLAEEAQNRYKFGKALILTSANLGTRASETLLMTASTEIAASGKGNFVDLENEVVHVSYQINDDPSEDSKSTKNGKRRRVVIPHVENVATGFDLLSWLHQRSKAALEEQRNGSNPLALIFPDNSGGIFKPEKVHQQVIRPATDALGWRMPAYLDARGRRRTLRRFTLHSMRDRIGVTAAEEWRYTDTELLQQGSWSDLSTVRKFYIGFTDVTQETVQKKHKTQLINKRSNK